MRRKRGSQILAVVAASALMLSACSGGGSGSGSSNGASGSGGDASKVITAFGGEPQNPLLPANTNEVYGGRVMDLLFNGLVSYDAKGKTVNEVADSITTSDSQHYDIKLKSGWKFTNGEAVDAKSFVDAWNYGALSTNAQLNSYFFETIKGYDDVSAVDSSGKPAPKAQTMSGLKVVSPTEFTVDLVAPQSDFPISLGYTAFAPLPQAAFKDMKAFGQNPIGDGPYKLKSWQHNVQLQLVPNEDYAGQQKPKNGGITFKAYNTPEAAYTDLLADNLDVLDGFPANALKTYKQDLPGRAINDPVANNSTLTVPSYLKQFSGQAGTLRRQALSMAIDRQQIADKIFFGAVTPPTDFTSPVLDGFDPNIPGNEVVKYDAAKAKQLWDQANAISPWDGSKPLTIAYNADGAGNKEYIDAVANQIKNTLGINAQGQAYATFKELRDAVGKKNLTGLSRAGWQADYPSLQNFLGPLYATGAGSNDGDYSSKAFDDKLKQAGAAKTPEEGNKLYNEAQQILFKDLPVIPLWYKNQQVGWSDNVSGVQMDWRGVPIYYNISGK